jgi:hypothetical protein
VLATRAAGDRCRYDATFRVACGREIPDHTTFSRFRAHLFGQPGWRRSCFTRFFTCARARGWGGWAWWPATGVKIAANASKEASRTEAGLRKLAGQVLVGARAAAADDEAERDRAA